MLDPRERTLDDSAKMSDHGHAGAAEGHGDHQYEYHGEATDEPGPGEPVTPGWLTLLGISLVLVVMLGFVAMRPDGKTRAELTPSTGSEGAAPAAPAPAPSADLGARVRQLASGAVRPSGAPSGLPFARPGASGMPRIARPPGQFAVSPGGPGAPGGPAAPGAPGGAPPPPRRPPQPAPPPQ
jgi:hypothetical protein